MNKYKIEIELLSDLCVSDGNGYNTAVDTDVCHDELGFPFIPAKRLKGCFRESALELNDWGKDIDIDYLFGEAGYKNGSLIFNNAYLDNYQKNRDIVLMNENHPFFHPQNILNNYTYIRTQTSVNYDTGVAKKDTLRTTRVISKGLKFYCIIEAIKDINTKDLEDIVHVTTNIGLNRTRGLGEVKMSLSEYNDESKESKSAKSHSNNSQMNNNDDFNYLTYHIHLEEPVVLKGYNSNNLNTMDYFEGNKILGLIANNLSKDEFKNYIDDKMFVSNAYLENKIDNKTVRLTEIPVSFYTYKDNSTIFFDKAALNKFDSLRSEHIVKCEHSYCCLKDILYSYSVDISDRYHHSRPNDKSIGHALEDDSEESKFFQISSIDAGQTFGGFISGSADQIKRFHDILNNKEFRIGFGRGSEYGKVRITVDEPIKALDKEVSSKTIAIKLNSPAIIYNDNAFYSTSIDDLNNEIKRCLEGSDKLEFCKAYTSITKVGGYNVTWKSRKPIINAFDKGTILVYKNPNSESIKLKANTYIGERVQEGFGEIDIYELATDDKVNNISYNFDINNYSIKQIRLENDEFVKSIADRLFLIFLKTRVSEEFIQDHDKVDYQSTVSNILLMLKRKKYSFQDLENDINARFKDKPGSKEKKYNISKDIIKHCKEECKDNKLINMFSKEYYIANYTSNLDIPLEYVRLYLYEMKYRIRRSNQEGGRNKNAVK